MDYLRLEEIVHLSEKDKTKKIIELYENINELTELNNKLNYQIVQFGIKNYKKNDTDIILENIFKS